jgi:ABC-type transport system involved in multi-copper enzyme maturation permease subunit
MEASRKGQRFLSSIITISKNTFREAVRDRVLYNLVLFTLLLTGCAIFVSDITAGQEARTIVNVGLNAMLLFGVFISIFVGVGLVSKEIEKRTIYAIFAKPLRRSDFLIGKYLGLCLTLLVNTAVMGTGVSLALLCIGGGTLVYSIWGAIFLIFLELAILTAVAILFSSFSSPALSALFTFLVFIIGHLSSSLRDFAAVLGSRTAGYVFTAIYYLFPNLAHFSFRTESANGLFPSATMVGGSLIYAVVYIAILMTIAIMIFRNRNFK